MAQEDSAAAPTQSVRTWWGIREWEGSQHRAFEELCFQLREEARPGWQTIKTAAPDGGVEWYDLAPDGTAHGFQVKFVRDVDALVSVARESAKTVGSNRQHRNIVELTFLVPFDLPDPTPVTPAGKPRQGARDRWNTNVAQWQMDLPGLADVTIKFVGGGELLERLSRPGNEGRRWFWFEQRALGADWFHEQMTAAERAAESRYTPLNHVSLPLSGIVDACALTPQYRARLARKSQDVYKAVARVADDWAFLRPLLVEQSDTGDVGSSSIDGLLSQVQDDADTLARDLVGDTVREGLPANDGGDLAGDLAAKLDQVTNQVLQAVQVLEAAEKPTLPVDDKTVQVPPPASERLRNLADGHGPVGRAARAVRALREELLGDAACAAESGAWLLLGEAGQGKTHLLVDAARRTVRDKRPALVLFGQQLSGRDVLTEIARHCGLGAMAHRDLLQAMDAAGEASNSRFLLIIDALNDADDPTGWQSELPRLLGLLEAYPHIALIVSCRSTLKDLVLPERFDGPQSTHPGFRGREMEGLESYLRDLPSALPQVPMLAPAFGNPLFVKLYAESLREAVRQHLDGEAIRVLRDRTAVFDAFVDLRARQICQHLRLDPAEQPVHRALETLASRMAESEHPVLPRAEARPLVDAFAPHATAWPDTMLGQLLDHGLVSSERIYGIPPQVGIGFPYQAFGDDRVVRAVLDLHRGELDDIAPDASLPGDSQLRAWLEQAPWNHLEAATVLVPETIGRELSDVLATDATVAHKAEGRRAAMARSIVSTVPMRSARSITDRTVTLLHEAATTHGQGDELLESVIAVTAEPEHRLNADRLHGVLLRQDRPGRDASWGRQIYYMHTEPTALHRLLRWAEQFPLPADLRLGEGSMPRRTLRPRPRSGVPARENTPRPADAEVVRLSATTLIWTLTSPNRFLRDRATKALVQLLLGDPDTLLDLVDRFLRQDVAQVNDPYLFERLVLAAYGVLARTSDVSPQLLRQLAELLLNHVFADPDSPAHASRNVLVCDAATRIITMAAHAGVITADQAAAAAHPHACPPVGQAPTEEQIKERYPQGRQPAGQSWGTVHSSLSHFGDFARYRVQPTVDRFSMLPRSTPRPRPVWERRDDPPRLRPEHLPAFTASLPEAVRPALGSPEAVLALLKQPAMARRVLDDAQHALLSECLVPAAPDEQLADASVDADWAARWITARVDELGWSPELFDEFDSFRRSIPSSLQAHKAERFGKKYQWLALHELMERLANHHHVRQSFPHEPPIYDRIDPLLLDIDPSLPPAHHPLDEEDGAVENTEVHTTFSPEPAGFWVPATPWLPGPDDPQDRWIESQENVPDLAELSVRTDEHGRRWVVLHEHVTDDWGGQEWEAAEGQSQQWHLIDSWLVPDGQCPALLRFLKDRSLMGRWMPQARETHGVYLAELLHEPSADFDPHDDHWHVRTWKTDKPSPTATSKDDPAELTATRTETTTPHDDLYAWIEYGAPDTDNSVTQWRRRQEETRTKRLHQLAEQWHTGPTSDASFFQLPMVHADPDEAHGPRGKPVSAWPATQDYGWSHSGYDCSIDESVSVTLLSQRLMDGFGLRQHPSRPYWYDTTNTIQIQYRTHNRPTGRVRSLLVAQEWLLARLSALGTGLVQGLLGERQPVTTEPRTWQEFSQVAGLRIDGRTTIKPRISMIRNNHH
ncbi:hypothetical protein [Streptomyces canus]|uniref:hypothetical protein n=1 Tax=Streptomyces canus TaxID=58343 RepID=UPI00225319DC|nr:hypothetical protein [Streptomyces canus]MCX4862135.1 hypothetical protein [Streptomyces canus]